MALIALKRLWNRPLLTLLSIVGVVLAVGLVTSIPILTEALSFAMLKEELDRLSAQTGRPLFSVRVYVLPSARYPLSLEQTRELADRIEETLATEIGLPVLDLNRHIETSSVILRARDPGSPYGEPTILMTDATLAVLTGVESHITLWDGEPMQEAAPSGDALNVWMHKTVADERGIQAGERYEIRDLRHRVSIAVRIAGIWTSTDPRDRYWHQDPDLSLRQALLTREADYEAIAEPLLDAAPGFASWYLILDDSLLASDKMQAYFDGLQESIEILGQFLPDVYADSSPLEVLATSIKRQADLTALLFVFSVPLMGFLLYFMTVISTIAVRWQRREMAIEVSRGMRSRQLALVGTIESILVIGNLQFLYDQIGGTYLHYVWLKIDPGSDRGAMTAGVENMGVYINFWVDARDRIAQELARMERVGIFGTLTVGFLGAAFLSGIGLLVYNYASLQERLFRFTALRALGLLLRQIIGQVSVEYLVLMAYSVAGGIGIGAWASSWFIAFFQAADENVIDPPTLLPRIAWEDSFRIAAAFVGALVIAQIVVIGSALRSGMFQALRMGDRE